MSARRASGLTHDGMVRIGEEQYACKVTNMSATGAVLTFQGPVDLPARFTLMLTPLGNVVRACTVTWEEGEQIGVVFGDALPESLAD
jgi:PilZ domain-containing protein